MSTAAKPVQRAAVDIFHHDVVQLLLRDRVVDLADMRVMQLAGERGLGEEQLLVALAAIGVMELLRERHLDRDVARIEGVVAQVDLGSAALAELAQHRILPDLRQHRPRHFDSRLRARATARLTSAGAVPPRWRRAATEPSGVSSRLTSAAILGEKRRRRSSGSAARSRPETSASRTARATTSWASRNGK